MANQWMTSNTIYGVFKPVKVPDPNSKLEMLICKDEVFVSSTQNATTTGSTTAYTINTTGSVILPSAINNITIKGVI